MSVFDTAAKTLFADANMALDAIYRAGGSGTATAIRIIRVNPDRFASFSEARFLSDSVLFSVKTIDVPALAKGDTIEVDSEVFEVLGDPMRDAQRLVWTAEMGPA